MTKMSLTEIAATCRRFAAQGSSMDYTQAISLVGMIAENGNEIAAAIDLASKEELRPPGGTRSGTYHYLRKDSEEIERIRWWTGNSWAADPSYVACSSREMFAEGWRYVGPVHPREGTAMTDHYLRRAAECTKI